MTTSLCCAAYDALYCKLYPESQSIALETYNQLFNSEFSSKAPLFVTWTKDSQLRGCIGTFQPILVEKGVRKYAIISAFEDSRFPKMSKNELNPSLNVDVTILENFKSIDSCTQWVVGKHGLKLDMVIEDQEYSGTFLPSVAKEENWDQSTTLWYLLLKAGYKGVMKSQVFTFFQLGIEQGWLKLQSYEGIKAHLSYSEYEKIRHQILNSGDL